MQEYESCVAEGVRQAGAQFHGQVTDLQAHFRGQVAKLQETLRERDQLERKLTRREEEMAAEMERRGEEGERHARFHQRLILGLQQDHNRLLDTLHRLTNPPVSAAPLTRWCLLHLNKWLFSGPPQKECSSVLFKHAT